MLAEPENQERSKMKYVLIGMLATFIITTSALEANAVVCARGVYRGLACGFVGKDDKTSGF
jgi:hypothetical protein